MKQSAAASIDAARRRRILVADDNFDTREILERLLARLDCDVVLARDGQEALASFERAAPDLVILDVMMPKVDGIEACKRMKKLAGDRFVPVLMLSALSQSRHSVTGLDAGADEYLGKPFDPDELLARARALLRIKTLQDQLTEREAELAAMNRELDKRVRSQVAELVRMSRLQRYLSPGVVQSVLAAGEDPATRPPQRKDITVLFADIRSFTRLADQLEPEEVTEVIGDVLGLMCESVFRHDGTVNKILGDGILAVFNDPLPQPDHEARAVQAGLEMCERARQLQALYHTRLAEPLTIGVGIHAGPAIVGSIGRGRLLDYTAIGSSVNLASRVQSLAFDNSVVVTSAVYTPLRKQLTLANERREVLRGYAHPVRVAEVVALRKS